MNVFDEFYYSGEFYEHPNNCFIRLIPKKNNAKNLKDYRPTSLLSSVYKIIAKTLTMTLKLVMSGIIAQPQIAYIAKRQILDTVLFANECIEDRKLSGKNGLIWRKPMFM